MAEALEAIMLICFGLSWPMNACKNFKARTAAGTSWQFILLITLGYFAGIAAKFVSGTINWVLAVYFLNVVCIAAAQRGGRAGRHGASACRAITAPSRAAWSFQAFLAFARALAYIYI